MPDEGLLLSRPWGPLRFLLRPPPPTPRPWAGAPHPPRPFFDHRLPASSGLTPSVPGDSHMGPPSCCPPPSRAARAAPVFRARAPPRAPIPRAPQSQPARAPTSYLDPYPRRGSHACHMSANNNKLFGTSPPRAPVPSPRPGPGRHPKPGGSKGVPEGSGPGKQLCCVGARDTVPRDAVRRAWISFIALVRPSVPPSPRRAPGRAAHPAGAAAGGSSAAVVRFSLGSAPTGLGAPLSGAAADSGGWAPQRLAAP